MSGFPPVSSGQLRLKCGGLVEWNGEGRLYLAQFKNGDLSLEPTEARELVRLLAFLVQLERGSRS